MPDHTYCSALVTGAAHGIGAAIVRRLAAVGVRRFLLIDHEAASLERLAADLAETDTEVLTLLLDLGDASAVRRDLARALLDFGTLDIVVNNAGVATENEPDDYAGWQRVLAVNLDAPFLVIAAALNQLNEHGRIVNIASILGRAGKLRNTAYCASKHGLLGYTKALALDLAARRITVNAVLPGWVDTPLLQGELAAQAGRLGVQAQVVVRNARKQVPLKRFVATAEVAAMVGWLCSAEAAGVTAQSFVIDGGYTCGM